MPTDAQQVKKYLDFSLLQLAAESYWHGIDLGLLSSGDDVELAKAIRRFKYGFNDPTHPFIAAKAGMLDRDGKVVSDTGAETPTTGSNTPVLPGYNRMVADQADDFLKSYEIIDHHANDATGFAATLFRNKADGSCISSPRTQGVKGRFPFAPLAGSTR